MSRFANLPLLVILAGLSALAMLLPAAHASVMDENHVARAFFYFAILTLVLTAITGIATAGLRRQNVALSHLLSLVLAFVVLPVILAVPLHQADQRMGFLDAWFEMVSCLTTTGATVFDEPGRLIPTLHIWRALVGWLGGALILIAGAAILAPLDLGGVEVLSGRVPGRGPGAAQLARAADPSERLVRHALTVLPVYTGVTLALWLALLTLGEPPVMAMVLALSTLSTSGILPGSGPESAFPGLLSEGLVFAFMLLALSRRSFPGTALTDRSLPLWRDHEIRLAAAILVLVPALVILGHTLGAGATGPGGLADALRALWGATFTALSFLTTTGFTSTAWAETGAWSGIQAPGLMLIGLTMVGGGIATTAGGLKLLRIYALARHGERELDRIVHPHLVAGGGALERRLRNEGAYAAWVFFMLFAISLAAVITALSLMHISFIDAMVLAVAAVSMTGPLATVAADTPISYAALPDAAKMVLAAGMVVGRLEVLAILALLIPAGWQR